MRTALKRLLGIPTPDVRGTHDRQALLRSVRLLEIRARRAMEAGLTGQYRSAFRGRGLEFEEVRDYRYGDDVRTIDWNVTARSGALHVKLFREERDLTVLLLVDLSASTRCGAGALTVHDMIAEVSSLFTLAAARRDRVGAVLFDDEIQALVPPRRGWRHGLRLVRDVLAASPGGHGTAFGDALRAADRLLDRSGVVVAVVDADCPAAERDLRAVAARHELVLLRVADPLSVQAPPSPIPVAGAEAGGRGVVSRLGGRRPFAAPPGVDVVELRTDRDELSAVREVLRRRELRYAR